MERTFHEHLRALSVKLTDMGALVESRARDAMTALVQNQPDLAVTVASGDDDINAAEVEIDELCLKLLATQNPVASDLRRIRSILKANTDLERVGDQAVNIAQVAVGLIAKPPLRPLFDIARLGDVAIGMLHDSVVAFADQNVALAQAVLSRDDEADSLRDSIFRVLLTHMMADPATVERAMGLILVSRCLERIADHSTNIAEDLIFLVEGRDIRHQREDQLRQG